MASGHMQAHADACERMRGMGLRDRLACRCGNACSRSAKQLRPSHLAGGRRAAEGAAALQGAQLALALCVSIGGRSRGVRRLQRNSCQSDAGCFAPPLPVFSTRAARRPNLDQTLQCAPARTNLAGGGLCICLHHHAGADGQAEQKGGIGGATGSETTRQAARRCAARKPDCKVAIDVSSAYRGEVRLAPVRRALFCIWRVAILSNCVDLTNGMREDGVYGYDNVFGRRRGPASWLAVNHSSLTLGIPARPPYSMLWAGGVSRFSRSPGPLFLAVCASGKDSYSCAEGNTNGCVGAAGPSLSLSRCSHTESKTPRWRQYDDDSPEIPDHSFPPRPASCISSCSVLMYIQTSVSMVDCAKNHSIFCGTALLYAACRA